MDRTLLTDTERTELAEGRPDWEVTDTEMSRTFQFDNFSEAMRFVTRVAAAADRMDHHPDIDIRYNKVKLVLSTHSEGGLTGLDRDLSAQFDSFV